jgi:hypothetical protein
MPNSQPLAKIIHQSLAFNALNLDGSCERIIQIRSVEWILN